MNDLVLFIVSLAVNSLLVGLVVTGGTAIAFQLIRNSYPRLRYTLAVAAFVIAAFVPVAVTLAGADERQSPPITNIDTAAQTLLSPRTNLLNDLTLYVGGSWLGTLFSGIWIIVSIHLLVREATGYRRLRNDRKSWRLANAEQRDKFFCPDTVRLYFADEGFFTTGFFSAAIVLPHHFPDNLSRLSIRGIVLHEIAHAKWRDACINSLVRIIHGIFWVNPSLWFLDRIIRAEREAAADRSALVSLSNSAEADEANADYATAIITIAKLSAASSSPQRRLLAAMHFGEATNLENRIQRILNAGSQRTWIRLSFGFAVFLTSVLALTIIPVATVPLTKVPAEISPAAFSDTGELSAPGFHRQSSESATQIVEQKDRKLNKPKIQANSSAPNPNPNIVYRGDSAEPVIRIVQRDININREPVVRVVTRPVVRIVYSR